MVGVKDGNEIAKLLFFSLKHVLGETNRLAHSLTSIRTLEGLVEVVVSTLSVEGQNIVMDDAYR